MLPSLLLLLPLILAAPHPDPNASPNPDPFAIPPPKSSTQGRSLALKHTPAYVRRARDAALSKREQHTRRFPRGSKSQEERDGLGLDPSWLLSEAAKVDTRYNSGNGQFGALLAREHAKTKRAGEVDLTDHNLDASYSGSISIGTPAQTFDIVLDTGSSDLWVGGSTCTSGCSSMTTFKTSSSSSYVALNSSFNIQYGSGSASGTLGQDTVTMGGYSVASQTFATCSTISSGLINSGVSGIMGLSWQALAYSGATPWWITLAQSSSWSSPLFGFHLARWRDVSGATSSESDGGTATFGYLDSSLYSGSITYVSVSSGASYWQIPMDSMTMQGSTISLGGSTTVAIDTGTTLIGGPSSIIAAIYAAIPGSSQMTGSYANYYQYPCSTSINFDITFGGFTIQITDADFNLGRYSSDTTMCTGAAFIQSLSSDSPVQWIVGDTALKNVYSVYRYNPSAVGFANLAGAISSSAAGKSTTIPVVSSLAIVTSAGAGPSGSSNTTSTTSRNGASGSATASKTTSTPSAYVVTATVMASVTASAGSAAAAASSSRSAALPAAIIPGSAWPGVVALLGAIVGALL